MKVKDLITNLKKFNPETKIYVQVQVDGHEIAPDSAKGFRIQKCKKIEVCDVWGKFTWQALVAVNG